MRAIVEKSSSIDVVAFVAIRTDNNRQICLRQGWQYCYGLTMVLVVPMPQLCLEVTEGTVTDIHVADGQRVAKDDVVLELATDKAQTDFVAPCPGVVEAIDLEIDDTVAVGGVLLRLATDKPSEQDVSP